MISENIPVIDSAIVSEELRKSLSPVPKYFVEHPAITTIVVVNNKIKVYFLIISPGKNGIINYSFRNWNSIGEK
jgi:hypothetical protein